MISRFLGRRWYSKLVERCPEPAYDTGCTFCGVPALPADKQIDYERNLNGTSVVPWKHALVLSHGHSAFDKMPARLEMDAGSLVAEISAIRRRILSPEHPVLVANASLGEIDGTRAGRQVVYLFPDRKLVEFDIEHTEAFVRRYLVPEGWEPGPVFNPFGGRKAKGRKVKEEERRGLREEEAVLGEEQTVLAEKEAVLGEKKAILGEKVSGIDLSSSTSLNASSNSSLNASSANSNTTPTSTSNAFPGPSSSTPFLERPFSRDLVLICAHAQRDIRCGEIGPLLKAEFAQVLLREHLQDLVDVGYISHIGGHAYAGNVVYLPADAKRPPIWYGRVFPGRVQGVVHETIVKGNVIRELYRGNTETV